MEEPLDPTLLGIAFAIVLFLVIGRVIIKRAGAESSATLASDAAPADKMEAAAAPPPPESVEEADDDQALIDGLSKTRSEGFLARISKLFSGGDAETDVLDGLEEVLLTADIGVQTAQRLFDTIRESLPAEELTDPDRVGQVLRQEITSILAAAAA